jgi:hypothetical protein
MKFYVCHHIIDISTPLNWSGPKEELQQHHWSKWVWNVNFDKYVGGIIAAGLLKTCGAT